MRVFIGIDIPEDIKVKISEFSEKCQKIEKNAIKYVERENFHYTLKFLGEITQEKLYEVEKKLSLIEHKRFRIKVCGIGCFPYIANPKVLWVGSERNEDFLLLFKKVESSMVDLGFEPEYKSFTPHLTIGRFRKKPEKKFIDFINLNSSVEFGSFEATEFLVYESRLTPNGAIYSKIRSFLLV